MDDMEPTYKEPARSREELRRRIDEIWDRRYEIEVEPSPGLKELVDTQEQFLARIRSLTGGRAGLRGR